MSNEQSGNLLECPFCGQTPKVTKYPMEGAHPDNDLVRCETAGCSMSRSTVTLDKWNTRNGSKANDETPKVLTREFAEKALGRKLSDLEWETTLEMWNQFASIKL